MRIFTRRLNILFAVFLMLSSVLIPTANVFASPNEATLRSYGLVRYDPAFIECGGVATGNTTTTVKITESPTLKAIFTGLIAGGMNSVQAAAVMGNMYQESKFNSDAHETGNDIGYGLVQWSFGRRTNYEAYAVGKKVAASDIATQIEYIFVEYNASYKSQLTGTDFEKSVDIAKATESWMRIYEAPALTPESDPAALNTVRIPAATQLYELYKSLGPAAALDSVSSSNCANGVVAGSIVKTALGLALQSPAKSYDYPENNPTQDGTDEKTARDTYRVAKKQYNPTVAWSDCGGFIATVMVASGVDKNYPLVSVSAQIAYVTAHPEKYTIITSPTASDLQAGDILLSNSAGHTTLYIGATTIENVVYTDVDASLGQRVPSVRGSENHDWMLKNGAIIARIKS